MILQWLATILIVLCTGTVLYLKRRFSYWQKRNVFTLKASIPFGNAKDLFLQKVSINEEMVKVYRELRARGLKYGGYYMFGFPMLIAVDKDLVRNIFTRDFQHFTDHATQINEEVDPLSGNLFTLEGLKWKALRIKLTPTFTSGKLKAMFQTLADCAKDIPHILDEANRNSEPVDLKEAFSRYSTDVIGSCAFGIECNCLKNPDSEFRRCGKKVTDGDVSTNLKFILAMAMPWFLDALRIPFNKKEVTKFITNMVKQTVDYRDRNNFERKDFMQLLLELRDQTIKVETKSDDEYSLENDHLDYYQNGLTLNEIAAQAFVFFIAGFETSSTTATFLMYEISRNLDIQEKLRNEIADVLHKYNGQLTYDAIMEMTFLDKCVQETLRKYPPVPVLNRRCTRTYNIPDSSVVVEKGLPVMIPCYAFHHDPEFYPDPEKFDPERFSEEEKNKRPAGTYMPFGDGPRICIGLRFGILQTKVALISALRSFKFTLNPRTETPLKFDTRTFILAASGGVWVDAHRIEKSYI